VCAHQCSGYCCSPCMFCLVERELKMRSAKASPGM
jgi:hypothetical protein